ncbi:hypothetical protein Tco_0551332 [Tanacetum coccineum]
MTTLTRQLVCIAILALFGSTLALAHVVKPPPKAGLARVVKPPPKSAGLRKLQMDRDSAPQVNNFGASDSTLETDEHKNLQKDMTEAKTIHFGGDLGMSDRGIYGGGYGSGGYEKSNTNLGMGVNCQCNQNGFLKHYVIDPVHLLHIDTTELNMMKPESLNDMAPRQPGN